MLSDRSCTSLKASVLALASTARHQLLDRGLLLLLLLLLLLETGVVLGSISDAQHTNDCWNVSLL